MAEKYSGCATDTNDSLQDKVRAIDLGMTCSDRRTGDRFRAPLDGSNRTRVDESSARYERACIED